MRASKRLFGRKLSSAKNNHEEMHISGAEGISDASEISGMCRALVDRALSHSRGKPDKITITIEEIGESPEIAPLLSLRPLKCDSPEDAWPLIRGELQELGVSLKAIRAAQRVLNSDHVMRGAALISSISGRRMEPDHARGIRVSHLGIDKTSEKKLARRLSRLNINTTTVREALVLASKVAFCKDILAEVCISDDPDYTTGYLASRETGYLRIENIKKPGDMHGGRVFFINENSNISGIMEYLEKKAVIIV